MGQLGDVRYFQYRGLNYNCRISKCSDSRTEPVVLLGGVIQDKDSWRFHETMLCDWGTSLAFDLPGCGTSEPLPADHGPDFMADALHHALDVMRVSRVNLLGYSYGALIAQEFAHKYPGSTARVALVGLPAADPGNLVASRVEELNEQLSQGNSKYFADGMASLLTGGKYQAEPKTAIVSAILARQLGRLPQDRIEKYLLHVERNRRTHRRIGSTTKAALAAPPITVPLLVFTGEGDTFTPPQHGRRFALSCPHATVTTIKRSTHMVMLERPAESVGLVRHFFSDESLKSLSYCNEIEHTSSYS